MRPFSTFGIISTRTPGYVHCIHYISESLPHLEELSPSLKLVHTSGEHWMICEFIKSFLCRRRRTSSRTNFYFCSASSREVNKQIKNNWSICKENCDLSRLWVSKQLTNYIYDFANTYIKILSYRIFLCRLNALLNFYIVSHVYSWWLILVKEKQQS